MSKALYRKYRSKKFDDVIGQKHITDILSNSIKMGKMSHAYLLTGPRGVGKTSVARILAHEINMIDYDEEITNLDIIEIDAASNNSVEDIRDLREKAQIAPVILNKKVYIIDEVHMLSKSAFNALLKTLEEPPEHIVFILATTNIEKLPATIVSRTQRFSFRPISVEDAVKHLAKIAKEEEIKITKDALKLIAKHSEGSFRDSISLLDQLSGLINTNDVKEISSELIENVIGLASDEIIDNIISAVENKDINSVVNILETTYKQGISSQIIAKQLTDKIIGMISEKPRLLPLLDSLIEIEKSPQPQLKLLSVLGIASISKHPNKTIALSTPVHEISASVVELQEQVSTIRSSQLDDNPISKIFNWKKFIENTKENVALYSVLSKCNYELNNKSLTIYAGNKFYKKKLDDIKYKSALNNYINKMGFNDIEICTIPTSAPLKDSQAAAIAVIMGGGEEVAIEEI
ncbi:MAG TPA: DNA polymerase III subunit gamma/tau [Candidatus Saccharibacteria bacterium]|nr:DNA polymerase III subunit gamma/tau [Candidatus Saccharibacteria bacterium]